MIAPYTGVWIKADARRLLKGTRVRLCRGSKPSKKLYLCTRPSTESSDGYVVLQSRDSIVRINPDQRVLAAIEDDPHLGEKPSTALVDVLSAGGAHA